MMAKLIEPGAWGWGSWCGDCIDGYGPHLMFGRTGDCSWGGTPGSGLKVFVPP